MTDKIKFTVEFAVDPTWIADGFFLDKHTALMMLAKELGWADVGAELDARVIKFPNADKVAKLMGYADADTMRASTPNTIEEHGWANAED